MEISLLNQTSTFAISMILGSALSLLFDIFRAFNVSFKLDKKKIFINDIIYFVISAIITFMCILVINLGEIRVYLIIGEVLGFAIYRFTLSKFIFIALVILMNSFRKIILKVKLFLKKRIPIPKVKRTFRMKNLFDKLKRKNVLKNNTNV